MLDFHHFDEFSLQWWIFFTFITFHDCDENLFKLCFTTSLSFHLINQFWWEKNYSNTKLRTSSHWWFPIIGSFSKLFTIVLFGHRRNFPPDHFLFMIVINFDIDISRFKNHSDLITTSILAELGPAQPQLVIVIQSFDLLW